MLRTAILLSVASTLACAAGPAEARWEGDIQIPGRELRVVVDLAQNASGKWIGSATFPGLGIKGAQLADIAVSGADVRFTVKGTLSDPVFQGRLAGETVTGEFRQAGNTAAFHLQKAGAAQVDLPRASTPVPAELEGEWTGELVLNGNKLKATLQLENHTGAGATAEFRVVGKRDTKLPVDRVTQDGEWLIVNVGEYRIVYEGRIGKNEISGTFRQGPLDTPLVFQRLKNP